MTIYDIISEAFLIHKHIPRRSGRIGYGNIGDDAILLSMLQHEGDICYLADCTAMGQVVKDNYGIGFRLFPSDLRGNERVAFGGGTLINASAFPDNNFCKQAIRCIEMGCEVIWYAVGVDSINDPALVREALERSSKITVRTNEGAQLLRDIGVTKPIDVVGDPVELWNLPTEGVNPNSNIIGINLSSVESFAFEDCLQMTKTILKTTEFHLRLYPFSRHIIDPNEDDSLLLNRLLIELNIDRVHSYVGQHHPVAVFQSMKDLKAFIGTRYHSLLFAHKLGLPVIDLSKKSKAERLSRKFGCPIFDISKPEQIPKLVDSLIEACKELPLGALSSMAEDYGGRDAPPHYLSRPDQSQGQLIIELQTQLEAKAAQIVDLQAQIDDRDATSKAINESLVWSLIKYLGTLVNLVFPQNSRRYKLWGKISRRYKLWEKIRNALVILSNEGLKSLIGRIFRRLPLMRRKDLTKDSRIRYNRWLEQHRLSAGAIKWQKLHSQDFYYRSRVSLLLVLQENQLEMFISTLQSLQRQTYSDWELYIACNQELYKQIGTRLNGTADSESRVKILVDHFQDKAEAWNRLLALASGELVGPLDQGDRLEPHALFEVIYRFNRERNVDLVYSDEDVIQIDGRREQPFFKPSWSPDLLVSMNYVGRLWVCRKSLVEQAGGLHKEDGEASEYGLLLRLTEKAVNIASVKTVLYSRSRVNCHDGSPLTLKAENVLQETLARRGVEGKVTAGPIKGTYRVKRAIQVQPLVSVVIPIKGDMKYLRPCLESITKKSSYHNYEIIVVDNSNSRSNRIKKYFQSLPIKVVRCPRPLNWSQVNNSAASEASGDYILFVNDDIEVIAPDWIESLLEHAQRKEVGVVGAKLLYPDGTIQDAGMFLVDQGNGARHAFRGLPVNNPGYFGLASVQRNCSAVTSACMMIRRQVFEELGGFNEELSTESNDVDLCLRAMQKGYLVLYTPYALLCEMGTRKRVSGKALDDNEMFLQLWRDLLEQGDHYYNPNLSLYYDEFEIDDQPLETINAASSLPDKDEMKKILVVKLDHLGDVVLSLPAIRRLRQLFPKAHITVLVGSWAKLLVERESSVDMVLTYDGFFSAESAKPPTALTEKEKTKITEWLAGYRFDLAIDLRLAPETREFLKLSHASYTIGYANRGEFPWLTIALPHDPERRESHPRRHISAETLELVDAVAAESRLDTCLNWDFSVELQQSVDRLMKSVIPSNNGLIIGIHPGVGQPIRRWPLEYFARLADLICERLNASVLIFGAESEKTLAETILGNMRNKNKAFSLAEKLPLDAFLVALKKCDLFIGNNSGPGHMAASLGIPTLGIYGGGVDAKQWGPVGPNAVAVQLDVSCMPCYLGSPADCPHGVICLKGLHPEKVWEVALRLLIPKWQELLQK